MLMDLVKGGEDTREKVAWRCIILALLCVVWMERNQIILRIWRKRGSGFDHLISFSFSCTLWLLGLHLLVVFTSINDICFLLQKKQNNKEQRGRIIDSYFG